MTDASQETGELEPETQGYRVTKFGADVLCLFGALFLFHAGYVAFGAEAPGPIMYSLTVILPFAAALAMFTVALSPIDPRPHGNKLAAVVVGGILLGDIAVAFAQPDTVKFGTDTLLFSRAAVDYTVAGIIPYTQELTPALYGVDTKVTPTMDGGHVTSFSYPAGAIVAFIPQRLTGFGTKPLHLTPLVATVAVFVYLVAVSPDELAVAPVVIAVGLAFFESAVGGIIDALWIFPLLVSMHAVYSRAWTDAGLWFGLSAAVKQQPWLIAPFLLIWVLRERDDRDRSSRVHDAISLVGGATLSFLAVNLPFIIWDPGAWLAGVFTPLANSGGAPLIAQGVGVVAVRTSGLLALPKQSFTLMLAAAGITALLAYTRLEGRWRWLAFITPPLLLFWHWRSLPTYFTYYLPVAYMALLAADGALPEYRRWFIGRVIP